MGSEMCIRDRPPPPRDVSDKAASGRARKPSAKGKAAATGGPKRSGGSGGAAAADHEGMPPPPPKEEKRLSEGAILELFEQLDQEQQRKGLEATAERRLSAQAGPTPTGSIAIGLPAEQASGASNVSRQSGDGSSPFNQLSPLHLNDILTAL